MGFALLLLVVLLGEEPVQPRSLEQAGIPLPRVTAEDPADSLDQLVLDRTLYGSVSVQELDSSQAEEMVAAARRIVARRKEKLEQQRVQAEEGLVPRLSVTPLVEKLDDARRVLDLAEMRAALVRELAEIAEAEAAEEDEEPVPDAPGFIGAVEKFPGSGSLLQADFLTVSRAFERQFSRPLPVSAQGDTRFHRALGFDHRGRVDVAVDPDNSEGVWLRGQLRKMGIPYFAFRRAVAGKSSGRHIHIGPPSERLAQSWRQTQ